MIEATINYAAVVVAALAAFFVGFLWHGPLFGKAWMKMMNFKESDMKKMQLTAGQSMGMGFVTLLIVSFVISHFVDWLGAMSAVDALLVTFWTWLGYSAPVMFGAFLWENRSFKLVAFNLSYRFVEILVMTLIVTLWV